MVLGGDWWSPLLHQREAKGSFHKPGFLSSLTVEGLGRQLGAMCVKSLGPKGPFLEGVWT